MIPNGILMKVSVIWDRDHGSRNAGWYLQLTYADGWIEDERAAVLESLCYEESGAELISCAKLWLMHPDGMTDQEMDGLESIIEVTR